MIVKNRNFKSFGIILFIILSLFTIAPDTKGLPISTEESILLDWGTVSSPDFGDWSEWRPVENTVINYDGYTDVWKSTTIPPAYTQSAGSEYYFPEDINQVLMNLTFQYDFLDGVSGANWNVMISYDSGDYCRIGGYNMVDGPLTNIRIYDKFSTYDILDIGGENQWHNIKMMAANNGISQLYWNDVMVKEFEVTDQTLVKMSTNNWKTDTYHSAWNLTLTHPQDTGSEIPEGLFLLDWGTVSSPDFGDWSEWRPVENTVINYDGFIDVWKSTTIPSTYTQSAGSEYYFPEGISQVFMNLTFQYDFLDGVSGANWNVMISYDSGDYCRIGGYNMVDGPLTNIRIYDKFETYDILDIGGENQWHNIKMMAVNNSINQLYWNDVMVKEFEVTDQTLVKMSTNNWKTDTYHSVWELSYTGDYYVPGDDPADDPTDIFEISGFPMLYIISLTGVMIGIIIRKKRK